MSWKKSVVVWSPQSSIPNGSKEGESQEWGACVVVVLHRGFSSSPPFRCSVCCPELSRVSARFDSGASSFRETSPIVGSLLLLPFLSSVTLLDTRICRRVFVTPKSDATVCRRWKLSENRAETRETYAVAHTDNLRWSPTQPLRTVSSPRPQEEVRGDD